MAAKLEWDNDVLVGEAGKHMDAEVRTRAEGIEYDYKIWRPGRPSIVSEPYQRKEDARQDAEAEVRRLLKAAGVEVE